MKPVLMLIRSAFFTIVKQTSPLLVKSSQIRVSGSSPPLVLFFSVLWIPLVASAEVTQINSKELKILREQGVALIDVRRPDEWKASGIIEGSHTLTFFNKAGKYNVKEWLTELNKIVTDDQPFVLICEVGGRTRSISQFLDRKLGFKQVHNLTRGIKDWIKQGEKTVSYQPD